METSCYGYGNGDGILCRFAGTQQRTAVTRQSLFIREALLAGISMQLVDGLVLEEALLQGSGVNCPVCLG